MKKTLSRAHRLVENPTIPGDKSISHRGLILGALARGQSEIIDILEGGDVRSTAHCLKLMGVEISKKGNRTLINGIGNQGFSTPKQDLDCGNSGTTMRVLMGGQKLRANQVQVPGGPSTAAFWLGAASIIPNSKIEMHGISLNLTRTGFINVLKRMGAKVRTEITTLLPEPIGSIYLETGTLVGVEINQDEIPLLAIIATQAKGTTIVRGAEELRVKESERIKALASNLRAMTAELEVYPDGETVIDHADCVSISYPNFFETLNGLIQT